LPRQLPKIAFSEEFEERVQSSPESSMDLASLQNLAVLLMRAPIIICLRGLLYHAMKHFTVVSVAIFP
jgi:hypothetical protein